MRKHSSILAGFALLTALSAPAFGFTQNETGFAPPAKASVVAHPAREAYLPGEPVTIELLVEVDPGWHINSRWPTFDYLIPTAAEVDLPETWPTARVTYPQGAMKTFAFADEPLSVYDGQFVIEAETAVPQDAAWGTVAVAASLRYQACDDRSCLPPTTAETVVSLEVGEPGPAATGQGSAPAVTDSPRTATGIGAFLLFGFVGGLLLNTMPCVLPVLSLKLMGLVKSSTKDRKEVVAGSLATAAGILISFWALAAAAILAKSAGATVGWGIQFQQPVFVTALAFVVALFCLNLWGLFEVPLPRRIAGWAEAAGGEGLPSHFTAGLFATLMATPCSAPFLGTAVGFALAQASGVTLGIFTAVGFGMALPYFLLATAPGAIKLLPKPGVWMEHFRHFMGYLLAAAAIWLLYVLSSQVSRERLAFIEVSLLALALFVWIRHSSGGRGSWRWIGVAGAVSAVAIGLSLAAAALESPTETARGDRAQKLIPWVSFDREEAERMAGQGSMVFVDVTADWCFTCKVNERLVLETPEIEDAFSRYEVVPMKADWTNRDDDIAAFLADHGKYGIPFYLLYRPGREPHLFSELLTKDAVLAVLRETGEPGVPF
ncbi:MAG: hypothetical protein GY769_13265 [bacterium]|nr:hypothetical protein [bacterium]